MLYITIPDRVVLGVQINPGKECDSLNTLTFGLTMTEDTNEVIYDNNGTGRLAINQEANVALNKWIYEFTTLPPLIKRFKDRPVYRIADNCPVIPRITASNFLYEVKRQFGSYSTVMLAIARNIAGRWNHKDLEDLNKVTSDILSGLTNQYVCSNPPTLEAIYRETKYSKTDSLLISLLAEYVQWVIQMNSSDVYRCVNLHKLFPSSIIDVFNQLQSVHLDSPFGHNSTGTTHTLYRIGFMPSGPTLTSLHEEYSKEFYVDRETFEDGSDTLVLSLFPDYIQEPYMVRQGNTIQADHATKKLKAIDNFKAVKFKAYVTSDKLESAIKSIESIALAYGNTSPNIDIQPVSTIDNTYYLVTTESVIDVEKIQVNTSLCKDKIDMRVSTQMLNATVSSAIDGYSNNKEINIYDEMKYMLESITTNRC